MTRIGKLLQTNRLAQFGELLMVFLLPYFLIQAGGWIGSNNPLALQGIVWLANILMLVLVWAGLRLRGHGWDRFGLELPRDRRRVVRTLVQSVLVSVVAALATILPPVLTTLIWGTPQQADLSEFGFLRSDPALLFLTLAGVYLVSSFGEEVIYRGFLITRIAELGHSTKWATGIALVSSSAVFGLIHYDWGPAGMVQTAFMGLVLGGAYLLTGRNLWALILAHGYLDTVLILQVYLAPA
jgi:membrane protease YdiL (CAAX protease family)